MKFCRICGAKIKDDGQICPRCGFNQNESIAKAIEEGEIEEKYLPETFVPKNMKKKMMMANRLATAIVTIGIAALVLGGGYLYQHRNDSEDKAATAGQEESVDNIQADNAQAEQAKTAEDAVQ